MPALHDRRSVLRAGALGAGALTALGLSACTDNPGPAAGGNGEQAGGGVVTVTIGDDACETSAASVAAGAVTFRITNRGTAPNEFEVLAEDRLRIVSEAENIGPGSSVELTVSLPEGTYYTACKPNMVGDLVGTARFTVTPGAAVAEDAEAEQLAKDAVAAYTAYIKDQVGQQVTATQAFADAYLGGDHESARALYAPGRRSYERIEPTAEAFGIEEPGDLDVALDLRVQDLAADAGAEVTDPEVLARWTGWHRIEADLFSANEAFRFPDDASRQQAVQDLIANTQKLYDLVYGRIEGASGPFEVQLQDVVNGAAALMNEVATGKIVGEEDTFSHTDLDDFQANVEGAKVAWGNVQALLERKDEDLARTIEEQFAGIQRVLDAHRSGTGPDGAPTFVDYSTIAAVQKDAGEAPGDDEYTPAQKELSTAVNALAESLSRISGTFG